MIFDETTKKESLYLLKTTDGARYEATANRVLTSFSPSPIHLDVSDELEMEKNVALDS